MASSGVMEEHMVENSKQMRTVVSEIESSVLDSFSKLSSSLEKQRISAALRILTYLHRKETAGESGGICQETLYALNRLIRGLATARIYSRAGFFSTLVGLLSSFHSLKIEYVFAAIEKELQPTSNKTKGEMGEIYSGRVLAYGSLIESDLFMKGTKEQQKETLKNLLEAGNKKSYLSFAATSFLIKILKKIDETFFSEIVWPVVKGEIGKAWENHTLETLYVLLLLSKQYPSIVKRKFMAKHLGTPGIIVAESVEVCCKLLMDPPIYSTIKHPVYEEFCKQLTDSDYLVIFWENGIDVQLIKPNQRKLLLAVEMLMCILKHLKDSTLIPQLLTSNFMLSIVKSFNVKKVENPLLDKIQQLLDLLIKVLENATDKSRIAVVKRILFHPGDLFFEKHSGTKTVQLITKQLGAEGVKKLAKIYRHILSATSSRKNGANETDELPWTGWERLYAAQLLTRLMGHPAVQTDVDWKVKQLKYFVDLSLFNVSPSEKDSAVRTSLAAGVKRCFFRALDQRLPKLDDLRALLSRIVHYINGQLFELEEPVKLRQTLPEKSLQAWKDMVSVVQQLEHKAGDGSDSRKEQKASVNPVFHTMFLHMGLQLFADPAMAEEALQELRSCLAHTSSGTRKSRRLRESLMENGEPHWVEVAVDLLLSLLSHNSHLLRSLASCVFPHLCAHLTPTALHQILDVLDPSSQENPLSGSGDVNDSENEDEESESDDGGVDKTRLKKCKNTVGGKSATPNKHFSDDEVTGISDNKSEASESDNMLSESEVEEEDMKVNDKVRMAVQQALGSSAMLTDTESIDMDEMDEEEGKRLDAALSQAFGFLKQNNTLKQSKKQSRDERALTHFRIRVIDLLEVYLAAEPDLVLCIDMLLPLFDLLEFCVRDVHQKPLEMRIGSCLKKLSNVKKFSSMSDVNPNLLAEILTKLLDKGERKTGVYIDMSPKITMCCTFLLRCSEQLKHTSSEKTPKNKNKAKDPAPDIVNIFQTALEMFFTKRDCLLQVNLFAAVLQILWPGNWTLVPILRSAAFNPEVRPFRRSQAVDLLAVFYRNHRLLAAANGDHRKVLTETENCLHENSVKMLINLSSPSLLKKAEESENSLMAHGVKQKFVCQLLKLLFLIKRSHSKCEIEANIDWQAVASALSLYRDTAEMATDTKAAFNRLSSALRMSSRKVVKHKEEKANKADISTAKRESVKIMEEAGYASQEDTSQLSENDSSEADVSEDQEAESAVKLTKKKEKKKRKNSKNKVLLRKESKQLRLNAASEGMKDITFPGIVVADIRTNDAEGNITSPQDSHQIFLNGYVEGSGSLSNNVEPRTKKRKQKENILNESVSDKKKKFDMSLL